MMKHWFFWTGLFLLTLPIQGQNVDIRGTVRDRLSGLGVPDAEITLLGRGLMDTTDAQGAFQIYEPPTGLSQGSEWGTAVQPSFVPGRGILFYNPVAGKVGLRILDVRGREITRKDFYLEAGDWAVSAGSLEPGIYFGKLVTEEGTKIFRMAVLNSEPQNKYTSPISQGTSTTTLGKNAVAQPPVDSLRIVKAGYFSTVFTVDSFIVSGLLIDLDTVPNAPSNLSYGASSFDLPRNLVVSLTPTVTGLVEAYAISPALPAGLSFDTATGEISGIPTVEQSAATYRVTATNVSGSVFVDIDIAVTPPVYCPGTTVGGYCWYFGTNGESCTSVCTSRGGYNSATESYAGSGGDNANCGAVMTALAIINPTPVINQVTSGVGCASDYSTSAFTFRDTGPTTAGATGNNIRRACACNLVTVPPAPSGLTYAGTPYTWPDHFAITPLTPTYSGTADLFRISPVLPAGLSFDTTNGEISGTPTTPQTAAVYAIIASGPGGADTTSISITIELVAPSGFSYPNAPFFFTENVAITNQNPTVTGIVDAYASSPALPPGLSLHPTTGVISGQPTTGQSAANYIITASNDSGAVADTISITVNATTYCPGTSVGGFCWYFGINGESCTSVCAGQGKGGAYNAATLSYAGSGGTNGNCGAVMTALAIINPTPVSNQTTSGVGCASDYSGSAFTFRDNASTTVGATGSNIRRACACDQVPIPPPPSNLSYAGVPFTFGVGQNIGTLTPTVTGEVISYSVNPALPSGLSFNTTTGALTGTPSAATAGANYTVAANNAGGSTTFQVNITVAVLPVINFQYPASSYVFNQNSAITAQTPAYDGPVTSFSVSPALPSGLSIHPTTGVLSGTPTAVTAAANYIVTATNGGGSSYDTLNIQVAAPAPCAGTRVGGFCWYFGTNNQSCTQVCSTHGGYHTATQTYAGSGGNNTQCGDVMTALAIISPTPVTATGSGTYSGMGCCSDYTNNATTYRSTATTTEGASSAGNGSLYVRRACACQQ